MHWPSPPPTDIFLNTFQIERYDNDPSMAIVSVTKHLDRERLEKEYPEQVDQVAILSGTGTFDKHKVRKWKSYFLILVI